MLDGLFGDMVTCGIAGESDCLIAVYMVPGPSALPLLATGSFFFVAIPQEAQRARANADAARLRLEPTGALTTTRRYLCIDVDAKFG